MKKKSTSLYKFQNILIIIVALIAPAGISVSLAAVGVALGAIGAMALYVPFYRLMRWAYRNIKNGPPTDKDDSVQVQGQDQLQENTDIEKCQQVVPEAPDTRTESEDLEKSKSDEQIAALKAKLAYVGEQLTTLDLRIAGRMDGAPTEEGIRSALQQHLITAEQAEEARDRILRNTILQEQDEAERDSLIQQASVLQQELDRINVSTETPIPPTQKEKCHSLTKILGVISAALLITVIILAVKLNSRGYISGVHGNVYHKPSCPLAEQIAPKNRIIYYSISGAKNAGLVPCPECF